MKSLKSLRDGATKRAKMKNQDDKTPIRYDQKDEVPVFEGAGRQAHDDLKSWKHHVNTIGAYIEDHGTHYEAHSKHGGLLGLFNSHPDGEGRGHGYVDHPVGRLGEEVVESLEQLYPIFEQNGMFEANHAAMSHSAGQHAAHHHVELQSRAQAMAAHMRSHKAEPHNMAHQAKVADHMDYVTKRHGHEAARYTHMAAQQYAKGNDRGGDSTVAGAHKHALHHHGLLPEALAPARAKEAQRKANYEKNLADSAAKAGMTQSTLKHARRSSRYARLLTKEHTNPAVHEKNPESPVHNPAVAAKLPPLQSNGGLKKWRKLNGPPNHVEKGPIKTDNVIESTKPHDPNTCRACRHLSRSGQAKTLGDLMNHAKQYPNIHGSYATNVKGKSIKEEVHLKSGDKVVATRNLGYGVTHVAKGSIGTYRGKSHPYMMPASRTHHRIEWDNHETPYHIHSRREFKRLQEDFIQEAGSSKTAMKRKYLGKSKGRTHVGTKAHPVETKPKLVVKDSGAIGRVTKMPQPMPAKGI